MSWTVGLRPEKLVHNLTVKTYRSTKFRHVSFNTSLPRMDRMQQSAILVVPYD